MIENDICMSNVNIRFRSIIWSNEDFKNKNEIKKKKGKKGKTHTPE